MADVITIRNALATTITAHTGLRALGQARDQVSPPCAVIIPASPLIQYGATVDGAALMNLIAVILVTDGAPSEKAQRALDAYLGVGSGEPASIADALVLDPTLSGAVHFAVPVSVTNYGRILWAGVSYFGARVNIQCGVI